MKKILACALILSFSAASGGWLLDKVKSGAAKVKNAAIRVHNSSAATALRNRVKSGARRVGSAIKTGATKAVGYVEKQVSNNFGLPYQIMSTLKKLRKGVQAIETNYGPTTATANLIALCEECEAKPIKVMRSISDISNYIGEMEKLTIEDGSRAIPEESTNILLGYMRDLNNLVYEYSLPYMNNIKKMLNEASAIQSGYASTEETASDLVNQIKILATNLINIMDSCLKDTENLELNIDRVGAIIGELQRRGVNVTILTTCYMNLQNLIQSMNTLTKFKATGDNLAQTAQATATNLQQTASMSATNLVNTANSAVLQSTEFVNQGLQSSTEKLSEGIDSAMDFTQNAVDRSAGYLNDSANKLNQGLGTLSEKISDSANNFNESIEAGSQNMANKLGELTGGSEEIFDELPPYSLQEEPPSYEEAVSVEAN